VQSVSLLLCTHSADFQFDLVALLDPLNLTIPDMHDTVRDINHLQIVGSGNHGHSTGLVEFLEEIDDLFAGMQIQVPRRLISQYNSR